MEAVLPSVSMFHFCKSSFFSLKRILFHAISSRITGEAVNAYETGILGPGRPPPSRKALRSQIDLKRQYLHPALSWTHLKWITADELSGAVFLTVYLHFKTGLTQLFLLFGRSLRRSRKVWKLQNVSHHFFLFLHLEGKKTNKHETNTESVTTQPNRKRAGRSSVLAVAMDAVHRQVWIAASVGSPAPSPWAGKRK